MTYLMLFWNFFQIGLFSIGGGYAAIPLIQNKIVEISGYLTLREFADLITIAEMTPGPIAIGMRVAGIGGAVAATVGFVTAPRIIVIILARFYFKYRSLSVMQGVLTGLRPAVVALIASAGLKILKFALWGEGGAAFNIKDINYISFGLFALGLIVLRKFKPNPVFIIGGAGILGILVYAIKPLF